MDERYTLACSGSQPRAANIILFVPSGCASVGAVWNQRIYRTLDMISCLVLPRLVLLIPNSPPGSVLVLSLADCLALMPSTSVCDPTHLIPHSAMKAFFHPDASHSTNSLAMSHFYTIVSLQFYAADWLSFLEFSLHWQRQVSAFSSLKLRSKCSSEDQSVLRLVLPMCVMHIEVGTRFGGGRWVLVSISVVAAGNIAG